MHALSHSMSTAYFLWLLQSFLYSIQLYYKSQILQYYSKQFISSRHVKHFLDKHYHYGLFCRQKGPLWYVIYIRYIPQQALLWMFNNTYL